MPRYTGGFVTLDEVVPEGKFIDNTASGVWSIQEALMYTKSEIYPHPDNGIETNSRALFGGGVNSSGNSMNNIQQLEIGTLGDSTDFGDLTVAIKNTSAGIASVTRGIFHGGDMASDRTNIIQYVTIATAGNATDFGDLHVKVAELAGCSNSTRGISAGGIAPSNTYEDTISYITIASTGNVTDFGDLTQSRRELESNVASPTRGVFAGGLSGSTTNNVNTMDYITIASTGNATDFGDMNVPTQGHGGCSNSTRGLYFGGVEGGAQQYRNRIEYITIASTGDGTDFGDLTEYSGGSPAYSEYIDCAGAANSTRAVLSSSNGTAGTHGISYVTIASTGNDAEFGEQSPVRRNPTGGYGGLSGAHGGIG